MLGTGNKLIPVIVILKTLLLFYGTISASEIVFYTLSPEKTNSNLNQRLSWKIPTRQWISLNGAWQIKDAKSNKQIGKVNVPFSFSSASKILLEKEFVLKNFNDLSIFLNTNWINGRAHISVNGHSFFKGSRNYLPLRLEIPIAFLKPGGNIIRIELDPHARGDNQIPSWMPINLPRISSGILSSIYLELAPAFHVQSVEVDPSISDTSIHLKGKIKLSQPFLTLENSNIIIKYHSSEKQLFQTAIQITDSSSNEILIPEWQTDQIATWSVVNPKRYWVEVELDSAQKRIDLYRQEIALRSIQIQENNIRLNSHRLSIKGINYVYQTPDGNELLDPELVQQDLHWIKEEGFNAVRVILHPLPEQFYQLCDEIGLLCFQDLPFIFIDADSSAMANWRSYYDFSFQLAERFSSVIALGIAYQIDGESHRQMKKLVQFLNASGKSDPLRYVTSLNPNPDLYNHIDFPITEIIHRNAAEIEINRLEQKFVDYPYIPSAFSKPISYRSDSITITHDLLQIRSFHQKVNQQIQLGKMAGHFIPTYNDFYLDFPSLQNGSQTDLYLCRTGLVDLQRKPRQFYDKEGEGEADGDEYIISEARGAKSYLYIILGLLNLFLCLYSYRRFTEFRQNVNYSMKKPHGFFINLQERIIIPYGQSLLLIFGISLNGAIIWSSSAYYFRNNLIWDYALSLLFFSPNMKLIFSKLIWNQPVFLVVGMISMFIIFYGMALLIKLISLFGESRVTFRQSVAVSAWSAVPLLLLLPFGIIFYNLLLTMKSYWIIIVILLYFHVWVYLRWINGARVLTERRYHKIFALFTAIVIILTTFILLFYQYQINLVEHIGFVYHLYQ